MKWHRQLPDDWENAPDHPPRLVPDETIVTHRVSSVTVIRRRDRSLCYLAALDESGVVDLERVR